MAAGFDLALIDCPPNVQLCSWAALVAADGVVVPLQAEDYGAQGLVAIRRSLARVTAEANPGLRLIGYLITMFNKSLGVHISYEADLRQVYGDDVFATVIPLAKDFKEAVILRQPVGIYKAASAAAKVIAGLADELLERTRGTRSAQGRGGLPDMAGFKANEEARRNRLASMTDSRPAGGTRRACRGRTSSRAARSCARPA